MTDNPTFHELIATRIREAGTLSEAALLSVALLVVLDRHRPTPCRYEGCGSPGRHQVCYSCGPAHNAPCGEVRAIAGALHIPPVLELTCKP